ncbi:hypothetical protein LguiA_004844 [Lonicera macranthoides]
MPASFKVFHVPVRKTDTIVADFGESAMGRVACIDSGFWWIIFLRAYTKSTGDLTLAETPKCQKGMRLILIVELPEDSIGADLLMFCRNVTLAFPLTLLTIIKKNKTAKHTAASLSKAHGVMFDLPLHGTFLGPWGHLPVEQPGPHGISGVGAPIPMIITSSSMGKPKRVVLDVGCGVARFYNDVITMSFARKDEHKAHIQFALERIIPSTLLVIGMCDLTAVFPIFLDQLWVAHLWPTPSSKVIDLRLWVVNVVPVNEPNSLYVIMTGSSHLLPTLKVIAREDTRKGRWYELNKPRRRRERAMRDSLTLTRIVLLLEKHSPFWQEHDPSVNVTSLSPYQFWVSGGKAYGLEHVYACGIMSKIGGVLVPTDSRGALLRTISRLDFFCEKCPLGSHFELHLDMIPSTGYVGSLSEVRSIALSPLPKHFLSYQDLLAFHSQLCIQVARRDLIASYSRLCIIYASSTFTSFGPSRVYNAAHIGFSQQHFHPYHKHFLCLLDLPSFYAESCIQEATQENSYQTTKLWRRGAEPGTMGLLEARSADRNRSVGWWSCNGSLDPQVLSVESSRIELTNSFPQKLRTLAMEDEEDDDDLSSNLGLKDGITIDLSISLSREALFSLKWRHNPKALASPLSSNGSDMKRKKMNSDEGVDLGHESCDFHDRSWKAMIDHGPPEYSRTLHDRSWGTHDRSWFTYKSVLSVFNPFLSHLTPQAPHFSSIQHREGVRKGLESSREREKRSYTSLIPHPRFVSRVAFSFTIHHLCRFLPPLRLALELGLGQYGFYASSTCGFSLSKVGTLVLKLVFQRLIDD